MKTLSTILTFFILTTSIMSSEIKVETDYHDEGQPSFRIETPAGVYLYHKEGAGFSSLIDVNGRDWIQYREGHNQRGMFRGIPNAVFRGERGFFHPGHTGHRGSTSTLEQAEDGTVTIESTSVDGKRKLHWEIGPKFAKMTMLETDPEDPGYWFLYEGTPGGMLDLERSMIYLCTGEKRKLGESWKGKLPSPCWVAFTDPVDERSLVIWHDNKENQGIDYWPMYPMTVFGYGRYETVENLLTQVPATFYMALVETRDFDAIAAFAAEHFGD